MLHNLHGRTKNFINQDIRGDAYPSAEELSTEDALALFPPSPQQLTAVGTAIICTEKKNTVVIADDRHFDSLDPPCRACKA